MDTGSSQKEYGEKNRKILYPSLVKKNGSKPWQQKMWCVGKLNAEYRERMYALIELYHKPYNPKQPVVCFDEKSKQLLSSSRPAIEGKVKKVDYEYIRHSTSNIFLSVEPLAGKRKVKVTKTRKRLDFAHYIKDLIDEDYAEADRIHMVLDNLNTHFAKSFYETFDIKEAERILSKIQFHYTPKHASWLNMAEIEIGIMDRQCLNRRIPSAKLLKSEILAWQNNRNLAEAKIVWKFSRQDADDKLSHHYT